MEYETLLSDSEKEIVSKLINNFNKLGNNIITEIKSIESLIKVKNIELDLLDRKCLDDDEVILFNCLKFILYRYGSFVAGIIQILKQTEKIGFNVSYLNVGILLRAMLLDSLHVHAIMKLPSIKVNEISRSLYSFSFTKRREALKIGVVKISESEQIVYNQLGKIINDISKGDKNNCRTTTDSGLIKLFKEENVTISSDIYQIQKLYVLYSSYDHFSLIPFHSEGSRIDNLKEVFISFDLINKSVGLIKDFTISNQAQSNPPPT